MNLKKMMGIVLAAILLLTASTAFAATYTPGEYTGTAIGWDNGTVTVVVTVDEESIVDVVITGEKDCYQGENAINAAPEAIKTVGSADVADYADVDAITSSSVTTPAIFEALNKALAEARGEATEAAGLAFTAGTYEGTAQGYNGPVTLSVTFSDSAIENIEIVESKETAHVGDVAIEPMIADMLLANGSGVDGVSGATVTSGALRGAVNAAAEAAACTNMDAFKTNTYVHVAEAAIEDTYDVIVVGAGGAGMAAGAAAAQQGATVVVLEVAGAMGGNTLVAGGSFQVVAPAYVFDPENPDAETGYDVLAQSEVAKVKSDMGRLATLREIYNWSEEPFDGTVTDPAAIKTVDDYNLPARGVHAEYLPVLQTLKQQIGAYLEYADAKMAAGAKETDLTLFSTEELHIFQTYYGGLRLSADKSEWIYNDIDLVSQMVRGAYDIKLWLADQGVQFTERTTGTLIGCLWQRINGHSGSIIDGVEYRGNWGTFFKAPENTILTANEKNQIMLRTKATELIVDENGKVVGVKAERYDGTELVLHANNGVVLATGGYGNNIPMVLETNTYWAEDDLTADIESTNRYHIQGDGIVMAQAVGADVQGMGWTQLMPLGWVDNGDLAGGSGENVIYISPVGHENAGKRYVDESAERDVLSQGAYDYGTEDGIYVELSNGGKNTAENNVEGRRYYCTLEELADLELLKGIDVSIIEQTITEYDAYIIGMSDVPPTPAKGAYRGTIGTCDTDENGNYLPETYRIGTLQVRYLRPSTHHTMGGLVVDLERHVLREDGSVIEGLYAAGEVTGGFFAGNRLGGNAITEILVSGKIAGESAAAAK